MNNITHSQHYLPHEINTKYHAVKLYRSGVGVSFVTLRYHISICELYKKVRKFLKDIYGAYAYGHTATLTDDINVDKAKLPSAAMREVLQDFRQHEFVPFDVR